MSRMVITLSGSCTGGPDAGSAAVAGGAAAGGEAVGAEDAAGAGGAALAAGAIDGWGAVAGGAAGERCCRRRACSNIRRTLPTTSTGAIFTPTAGSDGPAATAGAAATHNGRHNSRAAVIPRFKQH